MKKVVLAALTTILLSSVVAPAALARDWGDRWYGGYYNNWSSRLGWGLGGFGLGYALGSGLGYDGYGAYGRTAYSPYYGSYYNNPYVNLQSYPSYYGNLYDTWY